MSQLWGNAADLNIILVPRKRAVRAIDKCAGTHNNLGIVSEKQVKRNLNSCTGALVRL